MIGAQVACRVHVLRSHESRRSASASAARALRVALTSRPIVCAVLLLAVGCSLFGQTPDESTDQQANMPCAPTAADSNDPQLRIGGGDLGARGGQLVGGGHVKVLWLRRNTSAGASLRLQGQQVSGPGHVDLVLPAASTSVPWPGGDLAHGYPSDFLLPSGGCWRFSIVDGKPEDVVVFLVE